MDHCQDYFCRLSMDTTGVSPSVVQNLQDYYTEASKFSTDNFSTLNEMVLSLQSAQQLQQWNTVWHKCQQTKQQLEEALGRAMATEQSSTASLNNAETQATAPERQGANGCVRSPGGITPVTFEDIKSLPAEPFCKSPSSTISSSSQFTFTPDYDGKLRESPPVFDDTDSDCTIDSTISCRSEPVYSGAARLRKQPMKKIMKKTMSYEMTPRESSHSEVHIHGYTGVYIKGLEVANNVSAEKKLQRPDVKSPVLGRSRSMSTPSRIHSRRGEGDGKKPSR